MKKSDLKEFIREEIIEILSEESEGAADVNTIADEPITEDIADTEKAEKEVTIDDDDSVVQIADKLAKITKEMRSVNNQYKKAEGEEKESLLKRLKQLTKIKRELEGLL